MGGFSSQIQPSQSSAPAGKNAGMSSMQMGMDPIEQSPQDQLLKTQQLQAEQSTPVQDQMGELGQSMGSDMGIMQDTATGQPQGLSGYFPMMGNGPMGRPQGKGGAQGRVTFPTQGGQPKMGMPNAYSNTVSPWDNQANKPNFGGGKGKGA